MRVLILAPSYWPAVNAGGPARSITNLATEAAKSHRVTVVTADRDLGSHTRFKVAGDSPLLRDGVSIHYVNTANPRAVASTLVRLANGRSFDIVLANSVWHRTLSFLPASMLLAGVIRAQVSVLMPRGELEAGALALKSQKKNLAAPIIRALYNRAFDVFGATSESEARSLRDWWPSKPCLLTSVQPDTIRFGYVQEEGSVFRLLFLGRVHPTKGLLELLRALPAMSDPCNLTIAGPIGDERYWQACQDVIGQLGNAWSVRHIGTVPRERLTELLWSNDLMVTLTMGENFGHTIAESLQAGCPVLATRETPWTGFLEAGGGWVVGNRDDPVAVSAALNTAASETQMNAPLVREKARAAFDMWQKTQSDNVIEQAVKWLELSGSEKS